MKLIVQVFCDILSATLKNAASVTGTHHSGGSFFKGFSSHENLGLFLLYNHSFIKDNQLLIPGIAPV